ncbi:MAG: glycosyl transferase, partial [Alphaproteobacteria bacterium]|nr:glycosyl transferase [Alphaproteobacteria bacterium]
MRILFTHQSFPAQYKHIVKHFVDQPGTEVVVLAQETSRRIEGTRTVIYKPDGAVAASANR